MLGKICPVANKNQLKGVIMTKKQMVVMEKLKEIIGKERRKMYPEKDTEIQNGKIKNITQAIAAYGAQKDRFIGMVTATVGRDKYDRILMNDYPSTIIKKTKIMKNSFLYFLNDIKKELNKNGYDFIYLGAFELQKDGTLHLHIYFSIPVKVFGVLFNAYHNYYNKITTKTVVKLNKKEVEVIPIGRGQLGIANEIKTVLERNGFKFKKYINSNTGRDEYRCLNLVFDDEFNSGSWPTLYFYTKENLQKHYSEKIVKYLTKSYTKPTRQKAVGSQFVKHNTKIVYEEEDWNEVQKKFIQKVCGRLYTASHLPIQISLYQKKRKQIMEIYPQYRNMNTLITDLLNGKATYNKTRGILICPNGEKLILK